MHTPSTGRTLQEVRLLGVKAAVCWNASIRRSARYLAPFDAAAVQLSMEAPTCIAESRRRRSGMTGRDWQQAHPGRQCRAGTAAAQVQCAFISGLLRKLSVSMVKLNCLPSFLCPLKVIDMMYQATLPKEVTRYKVRQTFQ